MGRDLVDVLREEVAAGRVVFVVGSGVSYGATGNNPVASWPGLLKNGVERCNESAAWKQEQTRRCDSKDLDDLLDVAHRVEERLRKCGMFNAWIKQTIGSLKPVKSDVLNALRDSGCPIATTNYDHLLEDAGKRSAISWRPPDPVLRFLRNDKSAILHLHGHWEAPNDIVLGLRSYYELINHEWSQEAQHILAATKTMVFVGCGDGLVDPNFESLRKWMTERLRDASHEHYRLALRSQVDDLRKVHNADKIQVIRYGDAYTDLALFLRGLGNVGSTARPKPLLADTKIEVAFRELIEHAPVYRVETLDRRPLFSKDGNGLREQRYFPLRIGRPKQDDERARRGGAIDEHPFHPTHVREFEEWNTERLLEAGSRCILRGGPGSGKSTFVAHLARQALQRERIPVLVSAAAWMKCELPLWRFTAEQLRNASASHIAPDVDIDSLASWIQGRVAAGRALIVVDGWDELGSYADVASRRLSALIASPAIRECPVVVTSREGYATGVEELDRPRRSPKRERSVSLEILRLRPRDPKTALWDAEHFVRLYVLDALRRQQLLNELERHEDLAELYEIPFVLSLVAWLTEPEPGAKGHALALPLRLHEVYDLAIRRIFARASAEHTHRYGRVPPLDTVGWNLVLDEVAWKWIHAHDRKPLEGGRFERLVAAVLGSELIHPRPSTHDAMAFLKLSRILQQPGEDVVWLHSTFQEFLAARWLRGNDACEQAKRATLADQVAKRSIWEKSHEQVLHFYGLLSDESRRRAITRIIAADQLAVPDDLQATITANRRAAVADVIGGLARADAARPELDIRLSNERRFVTIPIVPFWYGGQCRISRSEEHNYELAIQRWPVTVCEYARFVGDWNVGGSDRAFNVLHRMEYRRRLLNHGAWQDLLAVVGAHKTKRTAAKEFSPSPGELPWLSWERQQRSRWNHPVVLIDWYQAWMYCAWLTAEEERHTSNTVVVLPSDAEWERSARAVKDPLRRKRPRDPKDCDYPWHGLFDADRANTSLTGFRRTTPVGAFPGGNSGVELWDVSGNVWEWCADAAFGAHVSSGGEVWRSELKGNGYARVLRGGSFRQSDEFARCSHRSCALPELRYGDIGFRPARIAADRIPASASGNDDPS